MKEAKRIILIIILLVGGAMIFRFWALSQFDKTLDSPKKEANFNGVIKKIFPEEKKVSELEIKKELETPSENQIIENNLPLLEETEPIEKELNLSFVFPVKENNVFIGCKYNVVWRSEIPSDKLKFSLVDAGMRKELGPITSGIPKTLTEVKVQSLEWKVGNVWPGRYYILISDINDEYTKKRSGVFNIKKISEGTSPDLVADFCKK
jgi:hypothetical protein